MEENKVATHFDGENAGVFGSQTHAQGYSQRTIKRTDLRVVAQTAAS
jgi:hypothetical protein